mgnify:CR=1 FL=1
MVKCRSHLIKLLIEAFAISDGVKSRRRISRCQYTHLEPKQIAVRCEKLFRKVFLFLLICLETNLAVHQKTYLGSIEKDLFKYVTVNFFILYVQKTFPV